jgi:ABC-type lipoprotein release transport system permease subunit
MTPLRIAARGLRHYAGSSIATAAGVAVAACVISGSLIAGESVTTTLRESALSRIGRADFAVVGARPFAMRTAHAVAIAPGVVAAAPVLLRDASAASPDTDATAPRVQVIGGGTAFFAMYPPSRRVTGVAGRRACVSTALAADLGLRVGDDLVVRVAAGDREPPSSLFARRSLRDSIRSLRLEVAAILPPDGPGGFGLGVESGARRNVIVDPAWLSEQLDVGQQVDVQLVATLPGGTPDGLLTAIRSVATPDDLGFAIEPDPVRGSVTVRGTAVTLRREHVTSLLSTVSPANASCALGSMMLATRIGSARASAHYAVIGHSPDVAAGVQDIVLNRWLAEDLRAVAGASVTVEWLQPLPDGAYATRSARLRVRGVISEDRAAEQRWIAPRFKGITDAERIGDWDPPFPVDLSRITARDETYWDRYRAAPKAFVSDAMMLRMWGAADNTAEWVTAARYRLRDTGAGNARGATAKLASTLRMLIRSDDRILRTGPSIRAIRDDALKAAHGSSDFRALMLGVSMFIVASGIALAAMMMRLSAERRAAQTGVLTAIGFRPASAAAICAVEGSMAALVGAVVGGALGAPFALALVGALNSWWAGAVAGEPIALHVGIRGPLIGALASFFLGTLASWAAARRMARVDVLRLLAGWRAAATPALVPSTPARGAMAAGAWAVVAVVAAILVAGRGNGLLPEAAAALLGGAMLLSAGLGALSRRLADPRATGAEAGTLNLGRIARRNAALRRGQSVLVAGMIAGASFLLVIVATNVRSGSTWDVRDRRSGAGGFDLIARTSTPLAIGFDTAAGRRNLGFDPADERHFEGVEVIPCLLSPGVDASCLNLAKPTAPRVLGVPRELIERGGFNVRTAADARRPWALLARRAEAREVAAFGDAESVRWILQSGLGGRIPRETPGGRFTLRFDGLIGFSIFAGEVLVSDADFRAMFPSVRSPSYFLIRAPAGASGAVADALRRNLGDAGMEVRSTREVLTQLAGVQNTYLSAFLVLGGLGIALGTAGLGAVLLRSAYERRAELALMLALGFRRREVVRMVASESVGLLLYGIALGSGTAAASSVSRIASGEADVNWAALGAVLGAMLAVGLVSCRVSAQRGVSGANLEAMRSE